jgi:hypothetical protein
LFLQGKNAIVAPVETSLQLNQLKPMKTLQERIQALSTDELREIIRNYEQFEEDGSIGDCLLRSIAEGIKEDLGCISGFPVVLWMEKVAFEAYREAFHRYDPV